MSKLSKYHVEIVPDVWVDVYDVLSAFGVKDPGYQHAIKKMLKTGARGHKDEAEDRADILVSVQRSNARYELFAQRDDIRKSTNTAISMLDATLRPNTLNMTEYGNWNLDGVNFNPEEFNRVDKKIEHNNGWNTSPCTEAKQPVFQRVIR